jgi:hypothetical protein
MEKLGVEAIGVEEGQERCPTVNKKRRRVEIAGNRRGVGVVH